jgi:heat shock protein HtpX
MQNHAYVRHKLKNSLQALGLVICMVGLLALVGWLVFGWSGLFILGSAGVAVLLFSPRLSPRIMLGLYNARRLTRDDAPGLHDVLEELSGRAGLERLPELYYLRTSAVNAFSVGNRNNAVLALSHGMLAAMSRREIAGIIAHELSHVRSGDMWVMGLADMVSRMTSLMSLAGQILLLINLPLLFMQDQTISWWLILVLLFSPNLAALMQLALSRSREFNADLEAARISGDPEGLASALAKIERAERGVFERILMPGRKIPSPSVLRTHPDTSERVRRLKELSGRTRRPGLFRDGPAETPARFAAPRRPPRRRWPGIWY